MNGHVLCSLKKITMKLFQIPAFAAAIFLFSCNNADPKPTSPDGVEGGKNGSAFVPKSNVALCYAGINGRDTISMSMIVSADSIKGNLTYNLFEKDKNVGMVVLQASGDTLFGEYTFMSEGKVSIREVSFLKQGDSMVEGYGPVEEKNGRMVFSDRSQLQFTGFPLKEVDCNAVNKYANLGAKKDSL